MCTEKFGFLNLVDFLKVAFSVETVICQDYMTECILAKDMPESYALAYGSGI